jgi:hypothetical protein
MILARWARRRPISWFAALLWMSAIAAGITEPLASADRHLGNQAVFALGNAPLAARSAAAGVVARLVAQDRSFDGLLLGPPERMMVHAGNGQRRPRSRTTIEQTGASRPRRLVFRYDATAPPISL